MTEPTYFNRPSKAARATALLIDTTEEEMKANKDEYNNQSYTHGSPMKRSRIDTWVARLTAFRTHWLEADLDKPFTGMDLWLFFKLMTQKLKPNQQHLPAPELATFERARLLLVEYGTFTYRDFVMTEYDHLRIKILFDHSVYAGILNAGNADNTITLSDDEYDDVIFHKPTRVKRTFYDSDDEPLYPRKEVNCKLLTPEGPFDE